MPEQKKHKQNIEFKQVVKEVNWRKSEKPEGLQASIYPYQMKQFCVVLTSTKETEVVKPAPSEGDLETLTDNTYDKQVSICS